MDYCLFLKLRYLLDNFESINSYELCCSENRNNDNKEYFLIVHKNNKYFNKEELMNSMIEYFNELPINLSIIEDEG